MEFPDSLEMMERTVLPENQDLQEHLDGMVATELTELPVSPDSQDHQECQDSLDLQDYQD